MTSNGKLAIENEQWGRAAEIAPSSWSIALRGSWSTTAKTASASRRAARGGEDLGWILASLGSQASVASWHTAGVVVRK